MKNPNIPNHYFQLNQTNDLIKYSNAWNAYYYSTTPLMSDEEFDKLEQKLYDNGYDQMIENEKKRIFELQGGNHLMVSLAKIKETDMKKYETNIFSRLQEWFLKHKINYRELNFYVAPKFDGAALKIEFNYNGSVKRIITRGGQDYTEILMNNDSIQKFIKNKKHNYHTVTGELVLPKSTFKRYYSEENKYDIDHKKTLKNPRNAVNSLIVDIKLQNDLVFIPLTDGINKIGNWWDPIEFKHFYSLRKIYDGYANIDYLYDGIVLAYDVKKRVLKDNYPLNMVAIKFKSEGKQTKVVNIEWTKKKTGKLNPVLVLEPISLDGAVITRVSGYNYGLLTSEMKCGIGSVVEIRKGDDIVPKWSKTIKESDNFNIPENTHVIGKYLYYKDDDNKLQKFILGIKKLELEGIGPKNAEKIGSIVNYDIIELFNPENKSKFIDVFGYNAMINNLFKIYEIKNIPLNTVINILQFNGCGDVLSMKFAKMLTGIERFNRDGIDENVFNFVVNGEGRQIINDSIKRLKSYGVKVIKPIVINDDVITYEMTGNPPNISKVEFKNLVKKKYPNAIHTTLTKNTKYLITNDINSNTSKMNKARKYNIKIKTYTDVLTSGF